MVGEGELKVSVKAVELTSLEEVLVGFHEVEDFRCY